MKITYTKNLAELLGYTPDVEGETLSFKNVTGLCNGETEKEKFQDFCENAEIGQFIKVDGLEVGKVMDAGGDARNIYADENGIHFI